jgi:hypothetical protein
LNALHGKQGVIENAQAIEGDDDDRQREVAGPVAHGIIFGEGNTPPAHAFDGKVGEAFTLFRNGTI